MQKQHQAQLRATAIMEVLSGQMTATQAARRLGVSRKTYYQWQERALSGMLGALEDQPTGRPKTPGDPQKEQMQQRIASMEKEMTVLRQSLTVKESMLDYERIMKELGDDEDGKKNSRPKKK